MPAIVPNRPQVQESPALIRAAAKRYAMNPNRMLLDVLAGFEAGMYKGQIRLELSQSTEGVLYVTRESAERELKLLLGKVLAGAEAGAALSLRWSRVSEGLRLDIALRQPWGRAAKGGSGPWRMLFDALDI